MRRNLPVSKRSSGPCGPVAAAYGAAAGVDDQLAAVRAWLTRGLRSWLSSARAASGMSRASWNWYQAAFLLATCTVQRTSALSAVSSATGSPAAL